MKKKYIPLSVPNLKGNELQYVTTAIKAEWVSTGGPYVSEFEVRVADYVHTVGAVSCQNGTSGLHISLILAGVTKEDAVIVPTLTFIAAVNPVKYLDAFPIFMDCDDSLCMDPEKLRAYCEEECVFDGERLVDSRTGRHVKAIVVVHVFGNMADMVAIKDIADHYYITLIEDATEAIGTYYIKGSLRGKYAGTIGSIGVFSFNGNKIITTGGGGMIVSNYKEYLAHAKHLTTQAKSDEVNFIHDEIGYNYRMTNLQAAIGLAQLEQLENFITIKQYNYRLYKELLADASGIRVMDVREDIRSNRWFYAVYIREEFGMDRDEVIRHFARHNIQSRPIWGLIHEQKPYKDSYAYKIEKAKDYWQHVVNIPCSTNLTEEDVHTVASLLGGKDRL